MNKRKPGQCIYCRKIINLNDRFCSPEHERRYEEKKAMNRTGRQANSIRNNEKKRPKARFSRTLLGWLYSKPHPMAQN